MNCQNKKLKGGSAGSILTFSEMKLKPAKLNNPRIGLKMSLSGVRPTHFLRQLLNGGPPSPKTVNKIILRRLKSSSIPFMWLLYSIQSSLSISNHIMLLAFRPFAIESTAIDYCNTKRS